MLKILISLLVLSLITLAGCGQRQYVELVTLRPKSIHKPYIIYHYPYIDGTKSALSRHQVGLSRDQVRPKLEPSHKHRKK